MINLNCPICESAIELTEKTKQKERVTCPNCFAQLAFYLHGGKPILGCAICKEPIFDPGNCGDCERRRERQKLLEEGRL
jgi:C4-type Zn-finger protein